MPRVSAHSLISSASAYVPVLQALSGSGRISNPEVEEEFRRLYNLPQMRDVFVHFLGRRFVAKLERGLEI